VVTAQGGATSHAAVVSRALGRPCVVGCGAEAMALVGRRITVDGSGKVFAGDLPVTAPDERADPLLSQLAAWAAERSPVRVTDHADGLDPAAIFDVDGLPDLGEPDVLANALQGRAIARGVALATPAGARAAVAAGVAHIVTTPVLPALLAILAARREAAA
jgi:pyruvate,orthophosphate dikinase